MEKTVKQGAVIEEEIPEVIINGEYAVTMDDIYQLKGHRSGAPHGIKIPAGRTETAVASKKDKFELATVRTTVHGAAKGGIATVDHFIYVFYNRVT